MTPRIEPDSAGSRSNNGRTRGWLMAAARPSTPTGAGRLEPLRGFVTKKFGIARKLLAVCLAVGLPIVVMLVLMTKAKLGEIEFASKEIVGDAFQRPLEDALEHVSKHRQLWVRHAHEEPVDRKSLAAE